MSRFVDLTGQRFGKLLVLHRDSDIKPVKWICQCDCGNMSSVQSNNLRSGKSQSCGCTPKSVPVDLHGSTSGFLTYIEDVEGVRPRKVRCKCICGNITELAAGTYIPGTVQSCGCYQKMVASQRPEHQMIGKKFGKLTVIGRGLAHPRTGALSWLCRCDCGNEKEIAGRSLKAGLTRSCGCIKKGRPSKNIAPWN